MLEDTAGTPDSTILNENATIPMQADTEAGAGTPEDTADYKALIDSMQRSFTETVGQMKAQNESLQRQIGILIRNGATGPKDTGAEPGNTEEQAPYTSFAELGSMIGKIDR